MLILSAPSRAKRKPCCGNCKSGKPCCGDKAKPRPAFFRSRSGLWLPRKDVTLPKALLRGGYPSEAEWGGLWRPWTPALMPKTFDMSCLPCCGGGTSCCCEEQICVDDGMGGLTCDNLKATITNVSLCDGTGCFGAAVEVNPLVFNGTDCWENAGPIALGCGEELSNFALCCNFGGTCEWSVSFACGGAVFSNSDPGTLVSCDPVEITFDDVCAVGSACCPDAGPVGTGCVAVEIAPA